MNSRLLKIEYLFSTKILKLAGALNKGATPAALDELGEALGRELPEGGRVFPEDVCSTSLMRIRLEHFRAENKESLPEHEIGIFVAE